MLAKIVATLIVIASSIGVGTYLGYRINSKQPEPIFVVAADEPVVMRTEGGLLEVSYIKATEQFERTTDGTILGIPFGKTIARIRVPAYYRYHVELAPEWRFIRKNTTFVVISPAVKPSLPVAINTAQLQGDSSGIWSLITGQNTIAALQKSITSVLEERASSQKYIELQREYARKTITEFVEKWVLSQDKWPNSKDYKIRVFFADEPVEKIQSSGLFPMPYPSVND